MKDLGEKRKKYLKIFKAEADEHLAAINNGLVELEAGSAGPELIHNILRASHTLKGSSRMLGLEEIGAIAHKMEDLVKAIENGEVKVDPEVIDCLLAGADAIEKLLNTEEGAAVVDHQAVIDRLVYRLPGGVPVPATVPLVPDAPAPPEPEKSAAAPPAPSAPPAPAAPSAPPPSRPAPPEPAPAECKPDVAAPAVRSTADTLRVEASRLDFLIDLAGELLINKIKLENKTYNARSLLSTITDLAGRFDSLDGNDRRRHEFKAQLQELRNSCHEFVQDFAEDVVELDMNVQEIQGGALQLRMTPASTLFDEFPRLVRDLGRDLNKEIGLEVRGQETELDKRLLEQLRGPLIHILRNACDHGIEDPEVRESQGKPRRGIITLQAYHHGGSVVIEVADDGAGMDPKRIREVAVARGLLDKRSAEEMPDDEVCYLTLLPGFTTSAIITDLSGRGVGLDVVKTNVEALRGDMGIESRRGEGTRVTLRLPLTVSIIEALLVMQGGEIYALPLSAVEEVVRAQVGELTTDRGREAIPVRGRLLPLLRLSQLLGLPALPGFERELKSETDMIHLVVLKFRNQRLALEVDKPVREQEVLVKGLDSRLSHAPLISGATILRKGEPALILNVFDIFEEAEGVEGRGIREAVAQRGEEGRLQRILVVDDSITTRTIEKNILERAGYDVYTAVDAEQALVEVGKANPMYDLFVLDVDMPGMNGFELCERLRQDSRTQGQPVIICTSRATDEDKRRGITVGAQAYIVKGAFDQNVLLDTVRSLIGEASE